MSAKAENLQVLDRDIQVPGCTFTRTSLSLAQLDEQTLIHAGVFLAQVEGCRAWWWGDFLLSYCEFRLAQEPPNLRDEAKRDAKVRRRLFRAYTIERSDIARVNVDTLHEWRDTCEFYGLLRRRSKLSNEHHVEAMQAANGDEAVAADWLDQAEANGWTRPQLRAAIRRAKQQAAEPEEPMPQVHQQELFACARWSRTVVRRVPDMERHEAEQLLRDLQPILALAAALAERVAGKESITQAA